MQSMAGEHPRLILSHLLQKQMIACESSALKHRIISLKEPKQRAISVSQQENFISKPMNADLNWQKVAPILSMIC